MCENESPHIWGRRLPCVITPQVVPRDTMARSFKSKSRSRKSKATKKYKSKRAHSRYRRRAVMSIQPATYKRKAAVVRFDYENEWHIMPSAFGSNAVPNMMAFLSVMANCPNDIFHDNVNLTWNNGTIPNAGANPQYTSVPTNVGGQTTVNDWGAWSGRYRHYVVTGAKIQVTARPLASINSPAGGSHDATWPWTMHLYKTGATSTGELPDVTGTTTNDVISRKPYCKRVRILGSSYSSGAGVVKAGYLSQTYSARSFEGVSNPRDNADLKGTIGTNTAPGLPPSEKTRFVICLKNSVATPAEGTFIDPCDLMVRMRIQYTVRFGEPVTTSDVPIID